MSDPRVRPAAVAGTFYPADPDELREAVDELLRGARPRESGGRLKALLVPHAGLIYSGPVAASAYKLLEGSRFTRVILLGPAHHVGFHGLALPGAGAMATPLGEIAVDEPAAAAAAAFPQVTELPRAHAREHSLEVQFPFLRVVLPGAALLPLVVGDAPAEEVAAVLEALWGGPETLILISSDLSHYLPYSAARAVDGRTAGHILRLDETLSHDEACGATPVNGLLLAARRKGLHAVQLDLRNSGDTAGDHARVVGYGAFAFYE
jgi:hypothetical protein